MAKQLLSQEGIEFEEIDVSNDEEKRQEMIELSGNYTVPQIFIADKSIGGFTDLAQLSQSVNLRELVDTA